MNLVALAPGWLLIGLLTLLAASAAEDGWRMQISNSFSLAIALGAGIVLLLSDPQPDIWQNGLLLLSVLTIGTALFARGAMGGGDVKMLAACALWFDWSAGWRMMVAVALAGGLEVAVVMMLRQLPWPPVARDRLALLRKGEDLPYGIAIALGVAFSVWQSWR